MLLSLTNGWSSGGNEEGNSIMRRIVLAALAVTFLTVFGTVEAGQINVGDVIQFINREGTTGGGEFGVDVVGDSEGELMRVFCVERNEYLNFTDTFHVDSISGVAIDGGVGGPSPDPISPETAYLYWQFHTGTLSNYSYVANSTARRNSANSLQRAIWVLEHELTSTSDAQALAWISEANGSGWTDIGSVRVMNISFASGSHAGDLAQSQLIAIPEPASWALASICLGVGGVRAARRRRAQRRRQAA